MSERDRAETPEPEKQEGGTGLIVALVLLLISGYVFISSFYLPRPEGWQTAPGMLPMLLGGSLFAMCVVIILDEVKNGALHALASRRLRLKFDLDSPTVRTIIAVFSVGVFYFGLLRVLYFEIATIVFLFAMSLVFWRTASIRRRIVVAIALPIIIAATFQGAFGIPLPGNGGLVQDAVYWLKTRGAG